MSNLRSDNECRHEYFLSKKVDSLEFCKRCGIMRYDQVETLKPAEFIYECDWDQLEGFKDMINNDILKFSVDYSLDSNCDYLSRREFLVKFLKDLVEKFEFRRGVYYLAVEFLDYVLLTAPNFNYEIATYACFLLASKFYEYDPKLPSCRHIAQIVNPTTEYYEEKDIKRAEILCLKLLNYNLKRTTAFEFLEFYLKNGILFKDELINIEYEEEKEEILENINEMAYNVLEFLIEDNRSLDFSPMQISSAIVAYIREKFKIKESWPKRFQEIYSIHMDDFMNCYFIIKTLYPTSGIIFNHDNEQPQNHFNNGYINNSDFNDNKNIDNFQFQFSPNKTQNQFYANYAQNFEFELDSSLDETCYSYRAARNKYISNSSQHQYMYNFSYFPNNYTFNNQLNYINSHRGNICNSGNQNHSLENINCNISPFNNFYNADFYKNPCINSKPSRKTCPQILYNFGVNNSNFYLQELHGNSYNSHNLNNYSTNNINNLVNNYMFQ